MNSIRGDTITESSDCIACCRPCNLWAVGPCDHCCLCADCTVRFRSLYTKKECPLCKADMSGAFITRVCTSFAKLQQLPSTYDPTFDVHFVDAADAAPFRRLRYSTLENNYLHTSIGS